MVVVGAVTFAVVLPVADKSEPERLIFVVALAVSLADELIVVSLVLVIPKVPLAVCVVFLSDVTLMVSAVTVKLVQSIVISVEVCLIVLVADAPLQVWVMVVPSKVAV